MEYSHYHRLLVLVVTFLGRQLRRPHVGAISTHPTSAALNYGSTSQPHFTPYFTASLGPLSTMILVLTPNLDPALADEAVTMNPVPVEWSPLTNPFCAIGST